MRISPDDDDKASKSQRVLSSQNRFDKCLCGPPLYCIQLAQRKHIKHKIFPRCIFNKTFDTSEIAQWVCTSHWQSCTKYCQINFQFNFNTISMKVKVV